MIYIIGVKHDEQIGSSKNFDHIKQFKADLESLILDNNISIIAEEFSKQALETYGASPSYEVACTKNLKYIFCDPDINERKRLGIQLREETAKNLELDILNLNQQEENQINIAHKKFDDLRENEWLNRIRYNTQDEIVFVCGFGHTETFSSLLKDNGYERKVYKVYKK